MSKSNPEYKKKWYLAHRDEQIAKSIQYRKDHLEEKRIYDHARYVANPGAVIDRVKKYAKQNREQCNKRARLYRLAHPEQRAVTKHRYYEKHKEEYILRKHVRRVMDALELPKDHPSRAYIGCSPQFLRGWLESQFQPGMTWENYGTVWNIDHVVPFSWWDIRNHPNHAFEASHYSNLRPISVMDNLAKNNRYAS